MASRSYDQWRTTRAAELNQIEKALVAIGGTKRGRRYATQQVNRAYAVLLASHFQGFCRDLHSECVNYLISEITTDPVAQELIRANLTWNRQLDRGNAHPANLKKDFDRLQIDFWAEADRVQPRCARWRSQLESLNNWRNAISHQDFDPTKLGGTATLRLAAIKRWRTVCGRLARTFDTVMFQHLRGLTGKAPW